jgi:glycosyltransferase involved in cell wall biosynthesis
MKKNEIKLPVSINICTYNEEDNISECIKYLKLANPEEIIIIDGNSVDKTRSIVKEIDGVILLTSEKKGLAHQRQIGVDNSTQPFIMIVDADDRLDKNCIDILLKEMKENQYDAIQAQTLSYEPLSYWQKAMDYNLKMFISLPGVTNMIGRPALYRREVYDAIKFDPIFTFGSEDTDFSRQMEINNLKQGVGTGKSYRIHLSTCKENINKWIAYGKGDSTFSYKYPDRRNSIIKHLLVNYLLKKSFISIIRGKPQYSLFFFLQGIFRFVGFIIWEKK